MQGGALERTVARAGSTAGPGAQSTPRQMLKQKQAQERSLKCHAVLPDVECQLQAVSSCRDLAPQLGLVPRRAATLGRGAQPMRRLLLKLSHLAMPMLLPSPLPLRCALSPRLQTTTLHPHYVPLII